MTFRAECEALSAELEGKTGVPAEVVGAAAVLRYLSAKRDEHVAAGAVSRVLEGLWAVLEESAFFNGDPQEGGGKGEGGGGLKEATEEEVGVLQEALRALCLLVRVDEDDKDTTSAEAIVQAAGFCRERKQGKQRDRETRRATAVQAVLEAAVTPNDGDDDGVSALALGMGAKSAAPAAAAATADDPSVSPHGQADIADCAALLVDMLDRYAPTQPALARWMCCAVRNLAVSKPVLPLAAHHQLKQPFLRMGAVSTIVEKVLNVHGVTNADVARWGCAALVNISGHDPEESQPLFMHCHGPRAVVEVIKAHIGNPDAKETIWGGCWLVCVMARRSKENTAELVSLGACQLLCTVLRTLGIADPATALWSTTAVVTLASCSKRHDDDIMTPLSAEDAPSIILEHALRPHGAYHTPIARGGLMSIGLFAKRAQREALCSRGAPELLCEILHSHTHAHAADNCTKAPPDFFVRRYGIKAMYNIAADRRSVPRLVRAGALEITVDSLRFASASRKNGQRHKLCLHIHGKACQLVQVFGSRGSALNQRLGDLGACEAVVNNILLPLLTNEEAREQATFGSGLRRILLGVVTLAQEPENARRFRNLGLRWILPRFTEPITPRPPSSDGENGSDVAAATSCASRERSNFGRRSFCSHSRVEFGIRHLMRRTMNALR